MEVNNDNKNKGRSLRVLMVAFDRDMFTEGSKVRERIIEQGKRVKELHIIVYSRREHKCNKEQVSSNVWLYPTHSKSRWLYAFDAYKISKQFKGIDLVTTQDPSEAGIAGVFISRFFKSRLQVQVHTDIFHIRFKGLSILNRSRVFFARFILNRADCVRVVSNHIKQSLLETNIGSQSNISVLPVYIDLGVLYSIDREDLRSIYPQFDYLVMVASRLEKEKNIALAVRAMAYVIEEYPRTGLVILGEGKDRRSIQNLIKELNIQDNVFLPGWRENIAGYYKGADLVLNTSNFEGYGRSVVEARILGAPVVSTDVGVAREVGAFVTSFNFKEIGDKIKSHRRGEIKTPDPYMFPHRDKDEYFDSLVSQWTDC
jgi:glycosyltransferase involved in cell wall biosynthesis